MQGFSERFREFLLKYFTNYMFLFLGGPQLFPARYLANVFKGSSLIFVVFLMNFFENFSFRAYLYLILRGSYGFLWILKDFVFPDQNFRNKMTIASTIGGFCILSLYSGIDVLTISRYSGNPQEISSKRLAFLLFLYIFGVSLMLLSDCQKYFSKKYANSQENSLISSGFFSRNRNPNYFGEILVYSSFAAVSESWLAWIPLVFVWFTVFNLNIFLKDAASLSKKQGWEAYSRKSGRILFQFRENYCENAAIYAAFAAVSAGLYQIYA